MLLSLYHKNNKQRRPSAPPRRGRPPYTRHRGRVLGRTGRAPSWRRASAASSSRRRRACRSSRSRRETASPGSSKHGRVGGLVDLTMGGLVVGFATGLAAAAGGPLGWLARVGFLVPVAAARGTTVVVVGWREVVGVRVYGSMMVWCGVRCGV